MTRTNNCSRVVEALADDNASLPDELRAHATECGKCRTLALIPLQLATTAQPLPAGFSARATRGAYQKLATRRRRRGAWAATGVAALASLGLWWVVPTATPRESERAAAAPTVPTTPAILDDNMLATGLLDLARSQHPRTSASYRNATLHLRGYDALLTAISGETP